MTTATFVTNRGSFTAQLMPEHAPKRVQNFTWFLCAASSSRATER